MGKLEQGKFLSPNKTVWKHFPWNPENTWILNAFYCFFSGDFFPRWISSHFCRTSAAKQQTQPFFAHALITHAAHEFSMSFTDFVFGIFFSKHVIFFTRLRREGWSACFCSTSNCFLTFLFGPFIRVQISTAKCPQCLPSKPVFRP